MEPRFWRISRRDGKASLVGGIHKGQTDILEITPVDTPRMREVASACPVKVIKVS
jgi:ferredoxin